jgi:hypothetical protein
MTHFILPDTAEGKLTLVQFNDYAKKVAEAYMARPAYEAQYAASWKALIASLKTLYKRLQSDFTFEFTDKDPYTSMEHMRQGVKDSGVLKIYTGHSDHPVWTPEENHIFRAVHDAMGHLAGYQKGRGHRFDLRGELGVYNRQLKMVPQTARVALFTELVGQVCTGIVLGGFAEQKVCKLWGFDYVNVGEIDDVEYKKNFPAFKEKVAATYSIEEKPAEGSSLTRVWQHWKNPRQSFAIITAFKGTDDEGNSIPYEVNHANTVHIANRAREWGFGYFWLKGKWVDRDTGVTEEEESLFITAPNGEMRSLVTFCKFYMGKYRQDAFILKPEGYDQPLQIRHNTGYVENKGQFRPDMIGSTYSQLKNGRTFRFD